MSGHWTNDTGHLTTDTSPLNALTSWALVAALVGGLFKNMSSNASFLRDNLVINDNVLETAHQNHVQKVVSCLSTCVFPDKASGVSDHSSILFTSWT